MLERRSSRAIKWSLFASICLVLAVLTATGAFDDLFRELGPAVDGVLHDLNHD
jgi:hypothetical protein